MLRSLDDEDKLPIKGVHRHLILRSRTNNVPVEVVAWSARNQYREDTGDYGYDGMWRTQWTNRRKQQNFPTASLLWSSDVHLGWFHLFVLTMLRIPSSDQVVGTPKLVWTGGTVGAEVLLCRAPTEAFVCGLLFAFGVVAQLGLRLAKPSSQPAWK
jgi:hypothetical protein